MVRRGRKKKTRSGLPFGLTKEKTPPPDATFKGVGGSPCQRLVAVGGGDDGRGLGAESIVKGAAATTGSESCNQVIDGESAGRESKCRGSARHRILDNPASAGSPSPPPSFSS